MNSIVLDEDEIIVINSFVNEISENIITEGVLLFPYCDVDGNNAIKVIVIRDISLQYTTKVLGRNNIPMRSTKLKEIDKITAKYNILFKDRRLSFEVTNIDDYNFTIMHEKELMHMRELLSSTILFDRLGDIKNRQNRQIYYVSKYKRTPTIENIDMLVSADKGFEKKKQKES